MDSRIGQFVTARSSIPFSRYQGCKKFDKEKSSHDHAATSEQKKHMVFKILEQEGDCPNSGGTKASEPRE